MKYYYKIRNELRRDGYISCETDLSDHVWVKDDHYKDEQRNKKCDRCGTLLQLKYDRDYFNGRLVTFTFWAFYSETEGCDENYARNTMQDMCL